MLVHRYHDVPGTLWCSGQRVGVHCHAGTGPGSIQAPH